MEISLSGCPDNPPVSCFLISERLLRLPSVVLETIIPCILWLLTNSTILLISLSLISGDIFIVIGQSIFFSFLILPNLKKVTFRSDILKKDIKLNVANAALRTVDFKGGFDKFIITAKNTRLSKKVKKIKASISAKS